MFEGFETLDIKTNGEEHVLSYMGFAARVEPLTLTTHVIVPRGCGGDLVQLPTACVLVVAGKAN